jgi:phage tail sheath protein FI
MAETLLSPGVLTRENDTSQITQGPIVAGAAIVGPTVKGPVNIPTLVTSYSDYLNKFGGTFVSGGTTNEYLTSISAYNYFQQGGASLLVTRAVSGAFSPATSSAILSYNTSASFILETLSAGAIQNSTSTVGTNGILPSGSADNVRFEIVGSSTGSGVFSLLIRQGNDTDNSKIILEAWNNLSLDPNQSNYIEAVIGNQSVDISQGYTNVSGDYANKSRYVRVKQVLTSSVNYFDNNGTPVSSLTGSVPTAQTGSFGSATGTNTSIFGLVPDNYTSSLNLLANQDEFKFNVITIPGQTTTSGSAAITRLISLAQDRGDVISIIDVTNKGESVATAVANALSYDNSYAAAYYPWVQVNAPNTGKLTWVPPSTIIPSVFAYNDRVSAPWFAPAGFTRGGLSVIQAERKLSPSDRDTLYVGNVNSIATFPGQGVVAYGQKTLQKKASALDRINVRRLLIELKSYIGQIANTLVFEQNTNSTRNRFLSQVNPYLDSIQQRQGLYAYKVVMDDTNNTADVIDRNQLVGQIFIQPTKTAEFIILDFNVTPTGASFQ